MSIALLEAFCAAYNRHDLEALLGMVTDDCVFEMSAGPEPWGARHAGKAALRLALPWAWQAWPDARWTEATHVVTWDAVRRAVLARVPKGTEAVNEKALEVGRDAVRQAVGSSNG